MNVKISSHPEVVLKREKLKLSYFLKGFQLFLLLFGMFHPVFSQELEVTNAPPITPENLITNVFLGDGVEVLDVQFNGVGSSVGFFKNGLDAVGLERGLVMTTGAAVTQGFNIGVDNFGNVQASVPNGSTVVDNDLLNISDGVPVNDISQYIITFIPIADTLRFNYAFASEEYPEFVCSEYNDIFGFFIDGPGITGPFENNAENIARIPGTDLPVTINAVNPGVPGAAAGGGDCSGALESLDYSEFYVDNNGTMLLPVYDGITKVFTAEAVVIPCETYTIKLVIGDITDGLWDSGVFLEAKSFGTGSLEVETATTSLDGSIAEGCAEGVLSFSLPNRTENDYFIDYTIIGTALNGVDYEFIPEDLFIPAGDSIVSVPIIGIEDGIPEDAETILIDVQRDPCNRDTFTIILRDNPLVEPDLGPDLDVCEGVPIQLDGSIDIPLPPPPNFSNANTLTIPSQQAPVFSDINVFGVVPATLGPDVIKSICIDSLDHRWIDDMDIFLISPGGQFIELTTDNGADGGNGLQPDQFLNTCFTVDATTMINEPPGASAVPYTGDWLPEGVWSDLWDGEFPSNGTWRLQLSDDQNGLDGTLYSWSICFNPVYSLSYSWEPQTGLSCADCPDPIATPSETTTYTLTIIDSYGCQVEDEITIDVTPALDAPVLNCGTITNTSISIFWDDIPGNMGYEINIDGMGWMPPNEPLGHTLNGLSLDQTVSFEVRALGDCPGFSTIIECATPACTPPTLTATATDATCNGLPDGTVEANAIGGTGPYTFTLDMQSNTTGIFTNLLAGTYTIEVLDALSCPGSVQVTVGESAPIEATPMLIQGISCAGAMDGSATVELNGGLAPYEFLWDDMLTDPVNSNLSGGLHTLTIEDANGCQVIESIEIPEPEVLTLSIETFDASCGDTEDGMAVATVTGGTGNYTFIWEDGQTTDTAFALGSGMISLEILDENNCSLSETVEIQGNEAIQLAFSFDNVNCFGGNDGSASIIPSGGNGIYEYEWNTGENTPAIENLEAGDYYVVVSDTEGCFDTAFVTINEPTELLATYDQVDPSCSDSADGSLDIVVTGGTAIYLFNINGINYTDGNITDLAAGDYQVVVTDANDCDLILPVALNAPPVLELSADYTAPCFNESNGTATVTGLGGTGPYTYLWETDELTPTISNLPEGPIGVTVTDANDCTVESTVDIIASSEIELSIEAQMPSCTGLSDGSLQVIAEGGSGVYTYQWSNNLQTETINNITAGMYSVIVTDEQQCTAEISFDLGEPSILMATASSTLVGCNGASDGSATVTPSGGTMPYTYSWNDAANQDQQTAQDLTAGMYTVIVTDANNCTVEVDIEVDAATEIILTTTGEDILCNGDNTGAIMVDANGGTGTYSYEWSDPTIGNTPNPQNLLAGTYTATVSDMNGCMETTSITLTQPAAIEVNPTVTDVNCYEGADGAVALELNGGTGSYSFNWSTGSVEQNLNDLSAGNYTVEVIDENFCVVQVAVTVEQPQAIEIELTASAVDCFGESTGAIQSQISGGTSNYSFEWSNQTQSSSLDQIPAGEYTLRVTDTNNCEAEATAIVEQPEAPISAVLLTDDINCNGGRDGLLTVDPAGGTAPYEFSLNGASFSGSSTFIGLRAGDYSVRIKDAEGCEYFSDQVAIAEPDLLELDLGGNRIINFGQVIGMDPMFSGNVGDVRYDWSPKDSSILSCFTCRYPELTTDDQVTISLIITDENGCTAEDFILIGVEKERKVFVPSGFTPNADNNNDRLLVHGELGTQVRLFRIYDRWGELLYEGGDFEVNDPDNGWDGTYRTQPSSGGVYIWYLEVEYIDGATDTFKGHTTLIR